MRVASVQLLHLADGLSGQAGEPQEELIGIVTRKKKEYPHYDMSEIGDSLGEPY